MSNEILPRIRALDPAPEWRVFQYIFDMKKFEWHEVAVIGWVIERYPRNELGQGDELVLYIEDPMGDLTSACSLTEIKSIANGSNWGVVAISPVEVLTEELKEHLQNRLLERLREVARPLSGKITPN